MIYHILNNVYSSFSNMVMLGLKLYTSIFPTFDINNTQNSPQSNNIKVLAPYICNNNVGIKEILRSK